MKRVFPSYYSSFKCLAGACKNSCCIGWEIDIDEKTLLRYKSVEGNFGKRLKDNIDFTSPTPCFKLDASERCPFLNEAGLCDIILTLGEDSICNICTDHPRFRNFFSARTEMGLGLCCEACADIILSNKEKVRLIEEEDFETPCEATEYEQIFLDFRNELFKILQDRSRTVNERVEAFLSACGSTLPEKSIGEWIGIFASLEQLNPAWGELLQRLNRAELSDSNFSFGEDINTAFEQLLVYLTYRHMWNAYENDRIPACAAFVALSYTFLRSLASLKENCSMEYLTEICRIYSCEIEYSEDNMSALYDLLEC